jgi:hypothetical protein
MATSSWGLLGKLPDFLAEPKLRRAVLSGRFFRGLLPVRHPPLLQWQHQKPLPTADAGDDVACQHRFLVVKTQPVAQCQGPGQSILLDLMSLDHLRLGRPICIDAVERVEDEIGVIARRPEARGDRVEQAEVRRRNKHQFVGPLRPPDPGRGDGRKARASGP